MVNPPRQITQYNTEDGETKVTIETLPDRKSTGLGTVGNRFNPPVTPTGSKVVGEEKPAMGRNTKQPAGGLRLRRLTRQCAN